ncbi:DHA2 family efflux MFS transporter permease subunit [Planosporangium flavigriseum]|uniref:MFS transporter n=1 Tax=Planosporangium flavigriseum TaxID=373681 RepID=A0A8J3LQX6_9ACTN|nr:DHA2 family efflux MFS transporter permease subunit [Planosporangium flavigriseum]NJC66495.1 DHA2 family efflux MFS transporter permease subunit [Planosporangium flavigriseum]GIG76372.1 MFS transporter [Planosporangium flavigriseum]
MTTPQPGAGSPAGTGAPATAEQKPRHSPWLVLSVLCLGFFMILLDTTIVNIAIPDMIDRLHASLDQILWVLNAYILVYAVLLITAGRLGDLYGPKQLFIAGLAIFTVASAACGFATTPGQLIAARVAQGLGGALLTPQTLSVLTVIFPPAKRGAAFGIWGAVAGVATIAGPTLGGFIVTHWGWRWVFFVNLPVGVLALVLAVIVMPDLKLNRRHRLDLVGTALATVGLFLLTYGLIEGQSHNWGKVWGPITIPQLVVAGAVVLALFMVQQYVQRNGEPLVPFAIFRDRNFSVMNFVGAALGFGMLGLFLPMVIFLQSVLGLSALQAGLATAPMSVVSMFVAPFAGRMADKIGGKYILMAGLALFGLGMAIFLASAHPDSTRLHLLPGILVAGLGMGLTFAPLQTVAMRNIEPRMAGAASGLINTTRQLGSVIGSAAVGALLQNQLASKLSESAKAHAAELPPQFRDRFVAGFSHASGSSLEVGAGQSGVNFGAQVPDAVHKVITNTFHEGFTNAMHASLILPIVVLGLAALSCLLVKRRARTAQPGTPVAAGAAQSNA